MNKDSFHVDVTKWYGYDRLMHNLSNPGCCRITGDLWLETAQYRTSYGSMRARLE